MSLAKRVLNGDRLAALCVPEELAEVRAVVGDKPLAKWEPVKLRRTFNMTLCGQTIKFWRVLSVWHPNANSDLSQEGLREWGIIP